MNEFKSFNPIVNFIYFLAVTVFSCVFMHPVSLAMSFVFGLVYAGLIGGGRAFKTNLKIILSLAVVTAVINSAFNHGGMTVLFYLPSGNPFTLEAMIYGVHAAVMTGGVICWFYLLGSLFSSDKVIYLFSRISPDFALIFSMTLRFIPKISEYFGEAKKADSVFKKGKGLAARIKYTSEIFSAVVTRTLENSIDTADSMNARGYGRGRRTSFALYGFYKRDALALIYIMLLSAYIIYGGVKGALYVNFYPEFKLGDFTVYGLSVFAAYFMLLIFPLAVETEGAIKWKFLQSKI